MYEIAIAYAAALLVAAAWHEEHRRYREWRRWWRDIQRQEGIR